MALKKCKECGNKISKKAKKCPSCGAPNHVEISTGWSVTIIVVVVILIGLSVSESDDYTTGTSPHASNTVSYSGKDSGGSGGNQKAIKNSGSNTRKPDLDSTSDAEGTESVEVVPDVVHRPDNWYVYSFAAEMDGHTVWNATTGKSEAYGQVSWPVSNATGSIVVGDDEGSMFVVLSFSMPPNLVGGQIHHGFTTYKLAISFDGNVKTLTVNQTFGASNLYAKYPTWFIRNMKKSEIVTVRLPWYSQDALYFKFQVSGLGDALDKFK